MEKPAVSITEVFEHYGGEVYSSSREWQRAKCCLHDDRTASASVNEDEGWWSCRTCDDWGDVFTLVMRQESIEFKEAVSFVREAVESGRFSTVSGPPSQASPRGGDLLRTAPRKHRGSFVPTWTGF